MKTRQSAEAAPDAWTGDRRIAIVSHVHPSLSKGGAEIAAYTLFEGLLGLGLDPLFIAACASDDRSKLSLGSNRERAVFHQPKLYDHFFQLGSPSVAADLARILAEEHIGAVNFHHFMNVGLGALDFQRPHFDESVVRLLTLHEFLSICHNHGQMVTRPGRLLCERASPETCIGCFPEQSYEKFAQRRERFLTAFRVLDGFVSPSTFLARRFVEWGLPESKLSIIENGLHSLSVPHVMEGAVTERPWVIGYFGQINPFKGVDTLLRAASIVADLPQLASRLRLRIHGNVIGQSDSFLRDFNSLVERLPFLSYAGSYSNASVRQLMSQCDYVLVPSSWWENSPIVIQEAFAAGKPVICSDIGGMAEKVADGVSGLHFRVGDADDLVKTLERATEAGVFATLKAGVPPVNSAEDMARAYLTAFAKAEQSRSPIAALGEVA